MMIDGRCVCVDATQLIALSEDDDEGYGLLQAVRRREQGGPRVLDGYCVRLIGQQEDEGQGGESRKSPAHLYSVHYTYPQSSSSWLC